MPDHRIQRTPAQRAQPATMGEVVDLLNDMHKELRKYRVRLATNQARIERLEQQVRGKGGDGHG
ncbi:MAG: hypothetical protein RSP_15740 [Rhodanobacter sp.]